MYCCAANSTRAMSLMRTTPPFALVRTTILSNSGTLLSAPGARTVSCCCWFPATGGCPIWPAAACTFCAWIAAVTSAALMASAVIRTGSSQIRMEYWPTPKTFTLPTPGSRESSLTRLIVA